MFPTFIFSAILQTQTPQLPSLQLVGNKINVTIGGKVDSINADEDPSREKAVDHVAYRRDNRWAVWDDRGLTVRDGAKVMSKKLGGISVSPRAFAHDEIVNNLSLFKSKKRTKDSDSLSGSTRLGTKCYFVPRWTARDGNTWLEALVMVDLAEANPKPKFLGNFKGGARQRSRRVAATRSNSFARAQQGTGGQCVGGDSRSEPPSA